MSAPIHNYASATLDPDIELVLFGWSNRHGHCTDCGLPAAYRAPGPPFRLLCSVCAAMTAADGEPIIRLFEDD